jgi:hypothetical protein
MTLFLIPVLTALALLALAAAVYQLRYRSATFNQRLQRVVNADEAMLSGAINNVDDGLLDTSIPLKLQPFAFLGWRRRDTGTSRAAGSSPECAWSRPWHSR